MLYFAPWKITLIALVSAIGVLLAAPNVLPESVRASLPGWMPARTLNLGLDLQGGSYLLLEVELEKAYDERIEALDYTIRDKFRELKLLHKRDRKSGTITIRLNDPDRADEADAALFKLSQPVAGRFGAGSRDLEIARTAPGVITVSLSEPAKEAIASTVLDQSLEIVRRRIDALGTREPSIQRQGETRIIVQVPGLQDPKQLKDVLGKTAKMDFHLVENDAAQAEAFQGRVPADSLLLPQDNPNEPQLLVERRTRLSGDRLIDAQPGFDSRTSEPIVTFQFDTQGARIFGDLSSQNVGKRFAIVLDGEIISAPTIREAILGGRGQISGNFTVESANELAILLRSGALPAPMKVVEQRTVGAELGKDSVHAGEVAAVIGLAAVVVFMVLTYGIFGIFADLALAVNIALIVGALSLLQATLTLPGIAGIVLTIGMAVDANVLIFERIREELSAGKSPVNAIDAGYRRAMATIVDANITTLIAAVILFYLGSGPVRGFAVTLGIGIVTSVFTAVTLCRLFVALWLRGRRLQTVPI
ncbi:MAG: protein translocase subunit SecD [Alphaproteobacteria bacterium]|nr:protein translocase subunit SecD [Alphaproteobacteria bacterium]